MADMVRGPPRMVGSIVFYGFESQVNQWVRFFQKGKHHMKRKKKRMGAFLLSALMLFSSAVPAFAGTVPENGNADGNMSANESAPDSINAPETEPYLHIQYTFFDQNHQPSGVYRADTPLTIDEDVMTAMVNENPADFHFSERSGSPFLNINDAMGDSQNQTITDFVYDAQSGMVAIPKKYMGENLTFRVDLNESSPAYAYYIPSAYRIGGDPKQTTFPSYGDLYKSKRGRRARRSAEIGRYPLSAFQVFPNSSNDVYVDQDISFLANYTDGNWRVAHQGDISYVGNRKDLKQNMENTGTGAYAGYKGENSGFAVTFTGFDDPALNQLFGTAGLGTPGHGQSTSGRAGNLKEHIVYEGRNWMYGMCVQAVTNQFAGDPEFEWAQIKVYSYDAETQTAHCGFMVAAKGPGGKAAQDAGMLFDIHGRKTHPAKVQIKKVSEKPDYTDGNPNYSLEGAKFEIWSADVEKQNAEGGAHLKDKLATLTTDANGMTEVYEFSDLAADATWNGQGSAYWFIETKAPKGYLLDTEWRPIWIAEGETKVIEWADKPTNDPMFINLKKVNKRGENIWLAGAEFTIEYYARENAEGTPTRTWVIKTDATGYTRLGEKYKVSGDDFYLSDGDVTMPLGTVKVYESKAPLGFTKINDVYIGHVKQMEEGGIAKFKWDDNTALLILSNDPSADPNASEIIIQNEEATPSISTTAYDLRTKEGLASIKPVDGKPVTSSVKEAQFFDVVHTKDLIPGRSYTLSATLMDQASGKPVRIAGKDVTGSKTFIAQATERQDIEVSLGTLPLVSLEGRKVVVFETLTYLDGDGKQQAVKHEDLNDPNQTITVVQLGTTLTDAASGNHVGTLGKTVTVHDVIAYRNLIPGRTYTASGTLHYQKDLTDASGTKHQAGDPVMQNGKAITNTVSFKAEKANGSVTVPFTVDSTLLSGATVVAFEAISYHNVPIGVHNDLNDENQIVHFPKIGTTASDSETTDQVGRTGQDVTIQDAVAYENLIVGKEYTISGILMDQASGKPYLDADGREVRVSKTFKAEAPSGMLAMTFRLNAGNLAGRSLVVFEDLLHEKQLVASHADLKDEGQTIHFPQVRTEAKDVNTNDHLAKRGEATQIVDTVLFRNLIKGKNYTVKGVLMNQSTGKVMLDAEGRAIEATRSFVAGKEDEGITYLSDADAAAFADRLDGRLAPVSEADPVNEEKAASASDMNPAKQAEHTGVKVNGTILLTFTLDSSRLEGTTVVVFEDLIHNNVTVVSHTDLQDRNQSVEIPKLGTTAADGQTKSHVGSISKDATIVDTVSYEHLLPEKTYTVKGVLMDQASGRQLLDSNGNPITAETTFTTPKSQKGYVDGSIDLTYHLDSTLLAGKKVVVFEDLFLGEVKIASHADLKDKDQTIAYPVPPTPTAPPEHHRAPKTGDRNHPFAWSALFAISLTGITAMLFRVWCRRSFKQMD